MTNSGVDDGYDFWEEFSNLPEWARDVWRNVILNDREKLKSMTLDKVVFVGLTKADLNPPDGLESVSISIRLDGEIVSIVNSIRNLLAKHGVNKSPSYIYKVLTKHGVSILYDEVAKSYLVSRIYYEVMDEIRLNYYDIVNRRKLLDTYPVLSKYDYAEDGIDYNIRVTIRPIWWVWSTIDTWSSFMGIGKSVFIRFGIIASLMTKYKYLEDRFYNFKRILEKQIDNTIYYIEDICAHVTMSSDCVSTCHTRILKYLERLEKIDKELFNKIDSIFRN